MAKHLENGTYLLDETELQTYTVAAKGIPGAVRDAAPEAWGRRVIEHKLQRGPADLEEIDYPLVRTAGRRGLLELWH